MKIKIFVAMHKKYWKPNDTVYYPIHVGAEINDSIGVPGDNTGENISSKNPNFCELTALYWAWKNIKDVEYIGLCHYRRYFGKGQLLNRADFNSIFNREDYEDLLKDYNCILPNKRNYYIETVRSHYNNAHHKKDLDEMERVIIDLYPEYNDAFNFVMMQRSLYICNMFVMKWEYFSSYCKFLFGVLFELEKRIDIVNYNVYDARVFGFLSERLFNVWIEKNKQILKIKEVKVIHLEPINWGDKIKRFIKRKIFSCVN